MLAGWASPEKPRKYTHSYRLDPARWILAPWIVVAPLLACGAPAGPESTVTTSAPIYGGVEDNDASQNPAVVAVEVDNGGTTSFALCSRALLAPNVVLPAR